MVEGKITGNITCEEGSEAKLQLLDSGVVCGEIRVPTVVINGRVEGDVYASEHIELAAQAVVDGNVHYQLIEMVKGAQVNGNLVYGKAPSEPVVTLAEDKTGSTDDVVPVVSLNDDSKDIDQASTEGDQPVVSITEEKTTNANSARGLKSRGGRRR